MEVAPLTLAHTHARNAVLETRKSNPVAASEEHDLAAGEFSTAAETSKDREALRTLSLLEQHHKKLAQILRFQHENPASAAAIEPVTATAGVSPQAPTVSAPSKADALQQPPKLSGNARLPKRESSSIANNLASARGIPAQPRLSSPASPTLSSQQAGAKMTDGPSKVRTTERLRGAQLSGKRERLNRTLSQKQPWSPPASSPTDITSQQYVPSDAPGSDRQLSRPSATEDPFNRFYSTFETLISKISAPLAFAGLPLGSDTANQAAVAARKASANVRVDRQTAVSDRSGNSAEPDIARIFSRAALKALRDTTGATGAMGPGNTAESFYVVPTTGGTVSYAGILTRAEKEARRNSLEEPDDDFVDARETPASPEMLQRSREKDKAARTHDKLATAHPPTKTLEELQVENHALRQLTDTLAKRLHMWEVNAQSSSMALQQSLKAIHHHSLPSPEQTLHSATSAAVPSSAPATPTPAPPPVPSDYEQRIKELEEKVRLGEKELQQSGRENKKLRDHLYQYKDRWEKLKEGAKVRRENKNSTAQQNVEARTEAGPDVTLNNEIEAEVPGEAER